VTAHIAGGGGNVAALDLLLRYGLNVNGIPNGVPPLVYMMQWAANPAGPYWLLDHGADPNLAWGDAGEAPLHVAARRWNVAMVERLVERGANVSLRRANGDTAHKIAQLHGNADIAAWLLAHGAVDELSPLERFIAACARVDRREVDAILAKHPSLAIRAPANTTSCSTVRPRAATRRSSKRCSRTDSIRMPGTRSASHRCIARRWAAMWTRCACC
jgi:hypothetical protein